MDPYDSPLRSPIVVPITHSPIPPLRTPKVKPTGDPGVDQEQTVSNSALPSTTATAWPRRFRDKGLGVFRDSGLGIRV